MLARHVVPLPAAAYVCLPSASLLESTLVEVFILNSLKAFGMNTCHGRTRFAQFWCNVTPFKINTYKSVSKQTTLTPFRMNTYEKTGGGGPCDQASRIVLLHRARQPKLKEMIPARFQIRDLTIRPAAVLAPMAGVTDTLFRRVIRGLGGCGLLMTEFTSSERITRSAKKNLRYLYFHEEEHP